jgi:hypothetical protein
MSVRKRSSAAGNAGVLESGIEVGSDRTVVKSSWPCNFRAGARKCSQDRDPRTNGGSSSGQVAEGRKHRVLAITTSMRAGGYCQP